MQLSAILCESQGYNLVISWIQLRFASSIWYLDWVKIHIITSIIPSFSSCNLGYINFFLMLTDVELSFSLLFLFLFSCLGRLQSFISQLLYVTVGCPE